MTTPFTVSMVCWHDGEPLLRAIREAVFIREQNVPEELEWDGKDEDCRHALALSLERRRDRLRAHAAERAYRTRGGIAAMAQTEGGNRDHGGAARRGAFTRL